MARPHSLHFTLLHEPFERLRMSEVFLSFVPSPATNHSALKLSSVSHVDIESAGRTMQR